MLNFDDEKQNKQLEELKEKEEEDLISFLANTKYALPYVNLFNLGIDTEALRCFKEEDARKLIFAPFKLVGKKIYIGIHSPSEELKSYLKEECERKNLIPVFYMISLRSIEKVWGQYKELSLAEKSKIGGISISTEILEETIKKIKKIQDIKNYIKNEENNNEKHKITRLIEIILAGAIAIKASDIHFEPEEKKLRLRLRIDGVLQDLYHFDIKVYSSLNSRIKLLSGMKITGNNAQDGRFSIIEKDVEISIRTSLIPGAHGETIVMRILDPKSIQIELEELEIEKKLFNIIEEEIKKPNGLILLTGPTGSGKTTTLYAFLRRIYNPEINIITIEDPVEYKLDGITQTQVEEDRGYGFLEGLRAALRQDPDIIMVGEIRDKETAKTAVQSSLTGHLVFSTLHTNTAAGVIPRLIDLDVNPKIIPSSLTLSIAQRLIRKLCVHCKQERPPKEKELNILKRILNEIEEEGKNLEDYGLKKDMDIKLYSPSGCDSCNNTGYKDRIGIFEVVKTNEEIEKIITENPSETTIKRIAQKQGTLSMSQDGVVKILTGITSFEEVLSAVDLIEE